jgi:hypothetical protein
MAPGARSVLGFAPHSGWAAVVMLGGESDAPLLLARERVELSEAHLLGSKQPYHAIEALPPAKARQRLLRLEASAGALAARALEQLAGRAQAAGATLAAAGILDSAGRSGATLEAILASHALIHTADGNHFRTAIARACETRGLPVSRVPQRTLAARAATALRRPPAQLAAYVTALGRTVGAPWGADQKAAALLAWLLLATATR